MPKGERGACLPSTNLDLLSMYLRRGPRLLASDCLLCPARVKTYRIGRSVLCATSAILFTGRKGEKELSGGKAEYSKRSKASSAPLPPRRLMLLLFNRRHVFCGSIG